MYNRKERAVAHVEEFVRSGQEIPFSPSIGAKLANFANKEVEQVDIDQLVDLLESDAGFSTRILQLANSTYFSGIEKIVSLRRAITQVGFEEAINFMHMTYYRSILPDMPLMNDNFSEQHYWESSWSTAVAGKMLARPETGCSIKQGDLYIAGLLHGVGKIVLAFNRPIDLGKALQKSIHFELPFEEVQLDFFDTTDADIAANLLSDWQLSDNVCQAVEHIYHPEEAKGKVQELAGFLQLASCIAGTSGMGQPVMNACKEVSQTWIATKSTLPLAKPDLLEQVVEEICTVLQSKQGLFSGESESEEELPEEAETPSDSPDNLE